MPALPIIWAFIKGLPWKDILIGLAVAGLCYAAYHWAYERGRSSRDTEVVALTLRATTAEASIKRLQLKIDDQNKSIEGLKTAGDAKVAAGAAALAAVNADNAHEASTIEALKVSSHRVYAAGAPCTISKTLAGTKGL